MRIRFVVPMALALFVLACNGPSQEDCQPGAFGCVCVNEACLQGFSCVQGMCLADGGESGDEDGGECIPPQVIPITPKDPDAACLPNIPCAMDAHCEAGQVCNTALEPPACEVIYCGEAGTPCDDDTVCESGLSCYEGKCYPCDVCGEECAIDFNTDPDHCGCCDNPIPEGGSCINGEPICPDGLTACSGECVSLLHDWNNCGACGNAVGDEAECINGEIVCNWANDVLCGADCVSIESSPNHCGECFAQCPAGGMGCMQGSCTVWSYERETCADSCAAEGMGCDPAGEHRYFVVGSCGGQSHPLTGCDTLPPATDTCGSGGACTCNYEHNDCVCIL